MALFLVSHTMFLFLLLLGRGFFFFFPVSSDNRNIEVLYHGSKGRKEKGQGTSNYKEGDSQQSFLGAHLSFLVD